MRPGTQKGGRRYEHPLVIRISHWINLFTLAILVLSGLRIYWAYPAFNLNLRVHPSLGYEAPAVINLRPPVSFGLREFSWDTLVPVRFSQGFYDRYTLGRWLAGGLRWHYTFMWLYTATGLLYVFYLAASGQWRGLVLRPPDVRAMGPMLLYYMRLRKQPPPYGKYNPLQKFAYSAIVAAGILSVLTGVALYKPVQAGWLTEFFGGFQYTRLWHFLLVWIFAGFLVVHLIMVALSGWSNFLSIITGWKKQKEDREESVESPDTAETPELLEPQPGAPSSPEVMGGIP
ncbi:MAG: cytochrome b/b6 domain-containing protein [Candidatus Tectomicrobia bacterium]|uniref:Cytochrome b/b6 domain-containing protein n=1 Tax=Tectimicrobiota bacterium TaxID=2528274 RepID=A0A932M0T7_UNCTE|nr:cytochrome b/b6 domain-containing protein [Candidatus Tectomicrobia bacterium]